MLLLGLGSYNLTRNTDQSWLTNLVFGFTWTDATLLAKIGVGFGFRRLANIVFGFARD